jgi:hypothetical protein
MTCWLSRLRINASLATWPSLQSFAALSLICMHLARRTCPMITDVVALPSCPLIAALVSTRAGRPSVDTPAATREVIATKQ